MSKYTRRVADGQTSDRFAAYGLSANPFPIQPAAEYGSLDARNNGQIFDPSIRPAKVEQFRERFLSIHFGDDHILLGYLMSLGAVESTRGMGKTAMLLHFARELNANFGPPMTGADQRVVAIYVSPPQTAKRFDQLAWLSVRAFVEQVGRDVWVSLLLEAQQRGYLDLPTSDDPVLLADPQFLESKNFDLLAARATLRTYLITNGVGEDFASRFITAWGDPRGTLNGFETLPERKRTGSASAWLFTDCVNLLRSAAFTGMFWFVDELENVVNSQNAKDSITWAKELRTQLLDAPTAARQHRFIFPVFVTHTVVHNALSQAWARSGLEQFAPMHRETDTYTVQLEELNPEDSRRLLQAYLDFFRLQPGEKGTLAPFADDAVPRLAALCNYHPREILRQAHLLLERAATDEVGRINAKYVTDHIGSQGQPKRASKTARGKALLGLDQ